MVFMHVGDGKGVNGIEYHYRILDMYGDSLMQQLQDIPRILRYKGDAIAFERVPHSRKINYIRELPPSVNSRYSE